MILPSPIILTFPGASSPTVITELPVTIIDNSKLQIVKVQMKPFMKTLTLWEKEAYVQAGDYTQAQVEAKIIELLGNDIASNLLKLYVIR